MNISKLNAAFLTLTLFTFLNFSNISVADTEQNSLKATSNNFKSSELDSGSIDKYHQVGNEFIHDLSGVATNGTHIVGVDDGDKGTKYKFVRSMKTNFTDGKPFKLSKRHHDLESATFQDGYFIAATSLSKTDDSYNLVTRFKWDGENVENEQTINLKKLFASALEQNFPLNWYNKVSSSLPREGGLNIEGLTTHGTSNKTLIFGLRSPLYGDIAADPSVIMKKGKAILAYVTDLFTDSPSISFKFIDLKGHGVRGMEYIPHLKGYVIISGPVFKGNDYKVWHLPLNSSKPTPLKIENFEILCRPEGVIPSPPDSIVIFSEASGEACKNSAHSYLKVKISK